MIKNHDRSRWFGASDVGYIVGASNTRSFFKWWLTKLGLHHSHFETVAMRAGTFKEHQILDYLHVPVKDKQIKIRRLRLRVNLDGNSRTAIYEVKTHKFDGKPFRVPLSYKRQVWVQMYAAGLREAYIVAYAMKEEDYRNFFLPIDESRLEVIPIEYDENFINDIFLPSIKYQAECLKKGKMP